MFWCCWTLCADGEKKNKMGITFCLLPPSQIDVTTLAAGGYLPPPPPLPPVFPCHKALRTRRSEMEPEKGDRSWIHQLVHKKYFFCYFDQSQSIWKDFLTQVWWKHMVDFCQGGWDRRKIIGVCARGERKRERYHRRKEGTEKGGDWTLPPSFLCLFFSWHRRKKWEEDNAFATFHFLLHRMWRGTHDACNLTNAFSL